MWLSTIFEQGRVGELTAEVQIMLGLEHTGCFCRRHPVDGRLQHGTPCATAVVVAERQGIEHRCHSGAKHLPVMRHHRRRRRGPAHARPRLEMMFEIIGMNVDQPRQQVIAFEVDGARHHALIDRGNVPVRDFDAAAHRPVRQHDIGVA